MQIPGAVAPEVAPRIWGLGSFKAQKMGASIVVQCVVERFSKLVVLS